MMIVIGLTGGIGSGKSTVARYLAECGAAVIDADIVGHDAFKQDTTAYRDVVDYFGVGILTPEKEIDRKKLGKIVFQDKKARDRLNQIMWSRIWEMIKSRIDEYCQRGITVVVVEAFGLIEAGWQKLVDQVWVTEVSEKVVVERLKNQRGMTEAEILTRIHAQLSNEKRKKYADVVISNDGSPDEVRDIVKKLWENLPLNSK
jgi:dephospho-CoA kinase